MTRPNRFRFLAAAAAAAAALTLGMAGTAHAATSGQPTPAPTAYHHKHHPKPVTRCFLSLETEHDTLSGQPVDKDSHAASIEVVQLVRVCVTTQRRHADVVTVKDVTGPFAWEIPASGYAPTPHGLPASVGSLYTQQAAA
jgi:hypothetical protein